MWFDRRPFPDIVDRRWIGRHVHYLPHVLPSIDLVIVYRNTDVDYSSAYIIIFTDSDLIGYGMTFTIGRGNDIVRFFSPLFFFARSAYEFPFYI